MKITSFNSFPHKLCLAFSDTLAFIREGQISVVASLGGERKGEIQGDRHSTEERYKSRLGCVVAWWEYTHTCPLKTTAANNSTMFAAVIFDGNPRQGAPLSIQPSDAALSLFLAIFFFLSSQTQCFSSPPDRRPPLIAIDSWSKSSLRVAEQKWLFLRRESQT